MKNKKVSLDELFECLSFYADKENYFSYTSSTYNKIKEDNGSKARKILKRLVKEELNRVEIENNL